VADSTSDAPENATRADPRYPADAIPGITSMRLSPGDAVTPINISASGVLAEGKTRFVPGTRVNVVFEGPDAPSSVKGRIVRCQVSAIGGGGSLQYQSAIQFESRIDLRVPEAAKPPAPAPAKHEAAPARSIAPVPEPARVYNRW
jgi:PilZ domain